MSGAGRGPVPGAGSPDSSHFQRSEQPSHGNIFQSIRRAYRSAVTGLVGATTTATHTAYWRFCRVEPLDPERHTAALIDANNENAEGRNWTYLPEEQGPNRSFNAYHQWAKTAASTNDPFWHAIVDAEGGCAVGVAAYARIDQMSGAIEVGGINYSPRLQRRPAATEAMYLMMRRVFDELGYRRYEWKCDSLNAPSRAAALRLSFRYEGLFRQVVVYKERSRDTAWFSVVDSEWPALRQGFERWLDPANFDAEGRQVTGLASLREALARE